MPSRLDFVAIVKEWLSRRSVFEREALEMGFTQLVLGVVTETCSISSNVDEIIEEFLLNGGAGRAGAALQLRDFVTFFLNVQCNEARFERAMVRSSSLNESSGFTSEQLDTIRQSYEKLPQRFANWQDSRDRWRNDIMSVFTDSVIMEWHALEIQAIRSK